MDWTATMIGAAGAKPDPKYPLDGEDITEVLRSRRPPFGRTFFWRTYKQGGMRSGDWKYIREGESEFLYDLRVDEHEQADFRETKPEVLLRLRNEFRSWEKGMQQYTRPGTE
jgi:arylsulfatase A-like enzyme